MKVTGTIRSTDTQTLEAEGEDYAAAKAALIAQIPEGFQLQNVHATK